MSYFKAHKFCIHKVHISGLSYFGKVQLLIGSHFPIFSSEYHEFMEFAWIIHRSVREMTKIFKTLEPKLKNWIDSHYLSRFQKMIIIKNILSLQLLQGKFLGFNWRLSISKKKKSDLLKLNISNCWWVLRNNQTINLNYIQF